jgi:type IV pilus assembly protein PilX
MNAKLQRQRGVTMVVVLVLLTVMLLGALAMARHLDSATVAAGNTAMRDSAIQASEVGLNQAFQAVQGLADIAAENVAAGTWYWPTPQPADAAGVPQINWDSAPEVVVGNNNSVRYVVERVCSVAAVTDPMRECLVRLPTTTATSSAKDQEDQLESISSRQFRITVRVVGPRNTTVFIQSLVTRG